MRHPIIGWEVWDVPKVTKGALRCLKVNIEWNMVDQGIQIFHIQRISLSSGRRTRRSPYPYRSPMWSSTWTSSASMSSSTLANGKETETFESTSRFASVSPHTSHPRMGLFTSHPRMGHPIHPIPGWDYLHPIP